MNDKLYRCSNANCCDRVGNPHEFLADEGICPKCGISQGDQRFGSLIIRCVMIHFDPPSPVPGYGLGVRACAPETAIHAPVDAFGRPRIGHGGTGDPVAVSCPACKATEAYQAAIALAAKNDDDDTTSRAALDRIKAVGVTGLAAG